MSGVKYCWNGGPAQKMTVWSSAFSSNPKQFRRVASRYDSYLYLSGCYFCFVETDQLHKSLLNKKNSRLIPNRNWTEVPCVPENHRPAIISHLLS